VAILVTSVRNGHRIDRVDLVDGKLTYETGVSQSTIERIRLANRELTDAEVYALGKNSSNGYWRMAEEV